jgi:hypothetical protein
MIIPTADQRLGKFSSDVPIKNPYTGVLHADGIIPATDIINFSSTVLASLPAVTLSSSKANYTAPYSITDKRNKEDLRIDQYFSEKLRIFGRYDQSELNAFDPGLITGLAGSNGNGTQIVPIKSGAGGISWAFNERTLLDAEVGYSQSDAGKSPPFAGGLSMLSLFGIPGLPIDPAYMGGISSETLIGFSALGRQATSPQFQHPKLFDPKVNLTRIIGKHNFKTGYELAAEQSWPLRSQPIKRSIVSPIFCMERATSTSSSIQAMFIIVSKPASCTFMTISKSAKLSH